MPITPITELIDRAKAVSDMRDNFVKPEQWLYWANQERMALDLFLARSGWDIALTSMLVNPTGPGPVAVDPDGGVMAIVLVAQVEPSSGRTRQLIHQDNSSFLKQLPGSTGATGYPQFFRVSWANDTLTLNLFPEARSGDQFLILYAPHPKKLVLSVTPGAWEEDSVSYPMGWEERVILGMARRALIKEESSTSAVDSEIGLWDTRIEEAAWSRVMSQVPGIRNSDPLNYGWTDRYSLPPYSFWIWV